VTDGNGINPKGPADKSVGEIVNEVSEKATLLVREEIELAKSEVVTKAKSLGAAGAAGAAAGVFLVFAALIFLHALAWFLFDPVGIALWLSFLIVFVLLVIFAAIAGFLAYRFVQKGAPPTPDLAIEEAKETRKAIEEVRR
jgi:VIT1/CCC1 family predicted Fe2+/Mn2+ transporter